MTNKEHIEKYLEFEKQGKLNDEINPIDWDECFPVTTEFPYIPKGFLKLKYNLQNIFFIDGFTKKQNKKIYKTEVIGRENLKGISSAIVTCNHFDIFDCLAIRYALQERVKYCVAEFNNRKGFLGTMMRAGGILPLSTNYSVLKNFNQAISHYLSHNQKIVFYPEQAMWYMYEKPRPFKNGAFYYAVKNNVPIIPLFITFRKSGEFDSEGLEIKYLTVHIMPPIYKKENLNDKENIEYLKDLNFKLCKNKYEEVYNKKLNYNN